MDNTPEIISADDAAKTVEICKTYGLEETEFTELRQLASEAKKSAYCPYSQFRVGATVLTDSGEFVKGANVENASYPVGTCAERVALGTAIVSGLRGFKALAVSTDISPPASPCGMCRQYIREFCKLDIPIIMFDKDENYVVVKLGQLLPMSFGPDQLPRPGSLGTS